jgi:hypothetical protein
MRAAPITSLFWPYCGEIRSFVGNCLKYIIITINNHNNNDNNDNDNNDNNDNNNNDDNNDNKK